MTDTIKMKLSPTRLWKRNVTDGAGEVRVFVPFVPVDRGP
jgi:hypothetical protein